MISMEEIRRIKEDYEEIWLEYKNVIGVEIGNKFVDHHRTDDLSIRVLLKGKAKVKKEEEEKENIPGKLIACFPVDIESDPSTGTILEGLRQGVAKENEKDEKDIRIPDNKYIEVQKKGDIWLIDYEVEKHGVKYSEKHIAIKQNDKMSIYNRGEIPATVCGKKLFETGYDEEWHKDNLVAIFAEHGISLPKGCKYSENEGNSQWTKNNGCGIEDSDSKQIYRVRQEDGDSGQELVFYDALKTDVINREFDIPDTSDIPEKKAEATLKKSGNKKLKGGIGIKAPGENVTGTLGAIVKRRGKPKEGNLLFLSCKHVLDDYNKNDNVEISSGEKKYVIGEKEKEKRKREKGHEAIDLDTETELDCDAIEISDISADEYASEIYGIGRIRQPVDAIKGMEVCKYGQTTGLTYGLVESVYLTLKISENEKPHKNQICIVPDLTRNWEFGEPGDSGSLVVDNNMAAVGLLLARSEDRKCCVATPIQAVLDELEVDIYNEELAGSIDRDIDESVVSIPMVPPPLTEDISRLLFGELICGTCCQT